MIRVEIRSAKDLDWIDESFGVAWIQLGKARHGKNAVPDIALVWQEFRQRQCLASGTDDRDHLAVRNPAI